MSAPKELSTQTVQFEMRKRLDSFCNPIAFPLDDADFPKKPRTTFPFRRLRIWFHYENLNARRSENLDLRQGKLKIACDRVCRFLRLIRRIQLQRTTT